MRRHNDRTLRKTANAHLTEKRTMAAKRDDIHPVPADRALFHAVAIGAFATGAIAIGAVAVGALVIGRLRILEGRIERLSIGTLTVDHLNVRDKP